MIKIKYIPKATIIMVRNKVINNGGMFSFRKLVYSFHFCIHVTKSKPALKYRYFNFAFSLGGESVGNAKTAKGALSCCSI
jgi:hypothetical protein